MVVDDKRFRGIGKMISAADISKNDVSNKMGADIGSSANLFFKMKWMYDVNAQFDEIRNLISLNDIRDDVEVFAQVKHSSL
jgi:hypothetical protein